MRRVIFLDAEDTKNYLSIFSLGDVGELYTLQQLENLTDEEKRPYFELRPGDAAMLIGPKPFEALRKYYHFGIRNENYYDCSLLRRLSIEGGAFVKCIAEFPTANDLADFYSEDFAKPRDFSWFKQKVIHDFNGAKALLDYMDSLPSDTDFGFDYEGSGMPLDKWYELSGVSICTVQFGGFISLTDLRHTATEDQYKFILDKLAKFIMTRMAHIWTYNLQYEYQVSHRMLGIDAYDLSDASVVNVLDGFHLKKFSLKWTGNRVLETSVWDTEFDRISELIHDMLLEEVGKLKKDKKIVIKEGLTTENFKETKEWQEIARRYPKYVDEFESLIKEYWGNEFMCIPSEILGYYCNLDAFYTLMIYEARKNTYSQECFQVFLDNIRLGARLMSHGLFIDEPFRAKYENYCHEQMAWSITYCAMARCWIKMEKHKKKAASTKHYNKLALKLIEQGNFFGGNPVEITKYILSTNLDTCDSTDTGLSEGSLLLNYGPEFAEQFISIVRDAMVQVKMKMKLDETVVRKKKILGIIAEGIIPILGLDSLPDPKKHIELEKYMFYKKAFDELHKVKNKYFVDINSMPEKVKLFGITYNLLDYSNYVSEHYFKCKSPIENDAIAQELAELYKAQTAYLTAMLESTQQLPETTKFYTARNITDINVGFQEFMSEWKNYYDAGGNYQSIYPKKVFDLALHFFQHLDDEKVKETWTNLNGFVSQSQLFPSMNEQYLEYEKEFSPDDLNDDFFFMRKMCLNYLVFKKYAKLDSTYVGKDGMFKKDNKYVIVDARNIPIREADPSEPGAITHSFPKFMVLEKISKRWSSNYHTILSHSDAKNCVNCGNVIKDGKIIYGGSDKLLTYFDISSAEVKI